MSYPINSKKARPASGNTQGDGLGTELRLLVDALGRLQVHVVGGAGSYPYNPETDDDSIPAGEIRETINVLLQGYDPVAADWERLRTDSAGRLQVCDGGGSLTVDFTRLAHTTDSIAIGDGVENLDLLLEGQAWGYGTIAGIPIMGRYLTGNTVEALPLRSDLDASPLGTCVVVMGRLYGFNETNWDRLRAQSAYANIDDTLGILSVAAVSHGEDLDVGAGNSEPFKVRTEDASLPIGEKHLIVVNLHYAKDPTNAHWEPVQTDGSGALKVFTP